MHRESQKIATEVDSKVVYQGSRVTKIERYTPYIYLKRVQSSKKLTARTLPSGIGTPYKNSDG